MPGVMKGRSATLRLRPADEQPCAAQIRNVALGSTADLMKNEEAHAAVVRDPKFLACILAALQVSGTSLLDPKP